MKAYECELSKGFFLYEYVDSLTKLTETKLPPHEAFYSKLKDQNITSEEYAYCTKIWRENSMETLGDFLVWYNNLDVVPFLQALEKQSCVCRSKGIDFLKDGVSVPSLATRYLFQESNRNKFFIPFINKKNSDHETVKQNIVGGPSLVFHRYHKHNKMKIRHHKHGRLAKPCKNIYGFDANALYLYSAMQECLQVSHLDAKAQTDFSQNFPVTTEN